MMRGRTVLLQSVVLRRRDWGVSLEPSMSWCSINFIRCLSPDAAVLPLRNPWSLHSDTGGNQTPVQETAEDVPERVAKAIMATNGSRDFRKLTAVCTAPILRADGSILDVPGHDATTV